MALFYRKKQNHTSRVNYNRNRPKKGSFLLGLQKLLLQLFIVGLLCIGFLGWHRLKDPHTFPFQQINIHGHFHNISTKDLQTTIQAHLNGGFFSLDIDQLRESLLSIPWVREVRVRRIWPNTLEISISEHRAIARWGRSLMVNAQYQIFSVPVQAIPPHLPLITVPAGSQSIEWQDAILQDFKQIQQQLTTIGIGLREIHVDSRLSFEVILNNGMKVILGQNDVLNRFSRFVRLYPRIIKAKADDCESVDLRYPNGLAIRWLSKQPTTTSNEVKPSDVKQNTVKTNNVKAK